MGMSIHALYMYKCMYTYLYIYKSIYVGYLNTPYM